jgi:hypothetical protein
LSSKKTPRILKEIKKHQPLEVNFGYHKLISYSQLSMYNQCSLKWALQYKEGYKQFLPSIHTVFGTSLHETLQFYLTKMYKQSGAEADRENIIEIFENHYREEYKKQYKNNNNQHFSDPGELREFFEDGINILTFFKKKKNIYFSKRGWHLVGCEVPIAVYPNNVFNNVIFQGFLDVVLYHEPTNTIKIIDIKTSTRGWVNEKKDENKVSQIILYKHWFSKQYGIPEDNIEVEFFIVKRKIYENSEYPQSRIQIFSPSSGKIKIKKALNSLNSFINEVFNKDGSYKENEYLPKPSSLCNFCPFNDNPDLCNKNKK